jgi:hypothetical protein
VITGRFVQSASASLPRTVGGVGGRPRRGSRERFVGVRGLLGVVGRAVGGAVGVFAVGEAWGVLFLGLLGGRKGFGWLAGSLVAALVARAVGGLVLGALVVAVSVVVAVFVGTVGALVVVRGVGVTVIAVGLVVVVGDGGRGRVGAVVDLEGEVADAVVAGQ